MATGYQYAFSSISIRRAFNPAGLKFDTWHGTNSYGYEYSGNSISETYEKGGSSGYVMGPSGLYTSGGVWSVSSNVGHTSAGAMIEPFNYYSVSFSANNGTVSWSVSRDIDYYKIDGSSIYAASGASVSISASPVGNDYYFAGWSDGASSQERTVTIGADKVFNANFMLKPYLTVVAGAGGSITTDPSGRVSPNSSYRAAAAPSSGDYRFVGWFSGGVLMSTDAETDIPVYASDVTWEARFASRYHTVNVSLADSSLGTGTVSLRVAGEEVASGAVVFEGTEVQIACVPKVDYNFANWIKNGSQVYSQVHSFLVSGTDDPVINCLAVLTERNTYDISVSKVDGSRGAIGLADSEKTWTEESGSISATGHSGVRYTVKATVSSSLSDTGRELNKFVGFTINGQNVASREIVQGYEYEADFTNGQNLASETLDDVDVVATFAQKALYHAELNIPVVAGGTAEIAPAPDAATPGSDKWLEGSITAVATPNTGYYVGSFNVTDLGYGSGGHVITPQKDADGKFRDSFLLNFNARITVNFLKIPCRPSVTVHSASAAVSAGTATVRSTAQGGGVDAMVYGDVAIYSATSASGYQFGGWFDADGNPAPDSVVTADGVSTTYSYTDAEYRVALVGDLALVARFKAQVALAASATASASGAVAVDGQTPPKWVLLGDDCEIAATPESGFFGAWYLASDASFASPLPLADVDTITVSDSVSYVARFISEQDALYIAMCNYDNDADVPDATLGNLLMTLGGDTPVEAQSCTEADFLAATELESAQAGAAKYYLIPGTARVSVSASSAMGRGFAWWTLAAVADGSEETEIQISESAQTTVVVNRHMILRAYWGDPRPSRIRVAFANGSNVTCGSLKIEGITVADPSIEDKTETGDEVAATFTQGDTVAISVDIKNGYLFEGWFYDKECTQPLRESVVDGETYGHASAEYRFVVASPVMICAKFTKDSNAIYRWEGDARPKMMTWKSKVYVANRPFDPVAVRVDATGYANEDGKSLAVSVGMYSSPDVQAKPSAVRTLQIFSQDSRRLPRQRPERYMQVQVESNCEVDAIFVGTSMEGLAI